MSKLGTINFDYALFKIDYIQINVQFIHQRMCKYLTDFVFHIFLKFDQEKATIEFWKTNYNSSR